VPRPLEALSSVVELAEVEEWHSLSPCPSFVPLDAAPRAPSSITAIPRFYAVGDGGAAELDGRRGGGRSVAAYQALPPFATATSSIFTSLYLHHERGAGQRSGTKTERERERAHYVYLCLIHSSSLCLCLCIGNHAYSSTTTTAQSSDRVILIEENPSNNVVVDHIGTVRANGARSNFPNVFQIGEFPVYFPTPPEGEQLFSTFINDIVDNGLDVGQNAPVVGVVTPSFGPIQVRPLGRQNLINERPKPPKFQVPAIPGVNVPLGSSSSSDAAALVAPVAMLVAAVAVLLF